jgi:glutamate racemase
MQPIGIFDSGTGGLGILREVMRLLPGQDLVYFADTKNFPYGEKTPEQLQRFAYDTVSFLIKNHNIKALVVACNTSSVHSLDFLRKHFTIPIIGTVPVVKPACSVSKTKKVAILATPAAASSAYQKNLIAMFAGDVQVFNIGCPGLADQVETGKLNTSETIQKLHEALDVPLREGIDVVGLACTHYPFLRTQIEAIVGPGVTVLDSNHAVAKQVLRVLGATDQQSNAEHGTVIFYASKNPEAFEQTARMLIGDSVQEVILADV